MKYGKETEEEGKKRRVNTVYGKQYSSGHEKKWSVALPDRPYIRGRYSLEAVDELYLTILTYTLIHPLPTEWPASYNKIIIICLDGRIYRV